MRKNKLYTANMMRKDVLYIYSYYEEIIIWLTPIGIFPQVGGAINN